jgi:hypothetical protein
MSRKRDVREYRGVADDVAFRMWCADLREPDDEYHEGLTPAYRTTRGWLRGSSERGIAHWRLLAKVAVRILGKPTEISGFIR